MQLFWKTTELQVAMDACARSPDDQPGRGSPNRTADDEQDRTDMLRLASGDERALNELMGRHSERLFHYLVRALRNESDAADLAQETFVRVYQHRSNFDGAKKFSTWLYAIASNLVRDRYRWRTRHPNVSIHATNEAGGNEFEASLPDQKPSPSELVQADERAEAVRCAVADLPEVLRAPLILSQYEGKTHAEIGAILSCSAKAVEVRIYRARQQLRDRLVSLL